MTATKIKFPSPRNKNGKKYWIPIVVKSKEYLLAYLSGVLHVISTYEFPYNKIDLNLDSSRFNDIVDTEGTRAEEIDSEEAKKLLADPPKNEMPKEKHPENKDGILKPTLLELECPNCGNYFGFDKKEQIPEENLICNVCENTLIYYTHKDDEDFEYDGDE
jgi:hypothetical protein